jgi:hypothetical protein
MGTPPGGLWSDQSSESYDLPPTFSVTVEEDVAGSAILILAERLFDHIRNTQVPATRGPVVL